MNYIQQQLFKTKYRYKLKQFFRRSGLFMTSKLGDKSIYAYPPIHSIKRKDKENCTEIVFSLLNGLDPKEMTMKKYYVFEQIFGNAIALKGDTKTFTLTIYDNPLKSNLLYNYKEIAPYLDEMIMPIVVGKKNNGQYIVLENLDFPHVIIQGASGSGKSSSIRVILSTLIQYKKPSELDIYCIDGKRAEFGLFKKVEHVQQVVYSARDAHKVLNKVVKEMYRREELLDLYEVPHVTDLPPEHKQKIILVAVDEFIEYMDHKEIMQNIIKITSKGRATGVLLLASAQRMDADVMNTKARSNFSIRMSFRTVDKTNAMLLGTKGAEKIKLDQMGRLILNAGELMELQSPHLTFKEAKKILNPYCIMKGPAKNVNEPLPELNENPNDDLFA